MMPPGKHTLPPVSGHDIWDFKKHLRQADSGHWTNVKSDESTVNEMFHYRKLLDVLHRPQHKEIHHIVKPLRTKGQWLTRSEKLWEIFNTEVFPAAHSVAIPEWEPSESSWPEEPVSDTVVSSKKDPKAFIANLYLKEKDFWGYDVTSKPVTGKSISLGLSVSNDWYNPPEISFQTNWASFDKFTDNSCENLTDTEVEKYSAKMFEIPESKTEKFDQKRVHINEAEMVIFNNSKVGEMSEQNDEIKLESRCIIKNRENDYNKLKFSEHLLNHPMKQIPDTENTITRCISTQTKSTINEDSITFPKCLYLPVLNV